MSNEDTLMKELYIIKQGTKESVKLFNTQIGYAKMRLTVAFPHTMPAKQAEETRKTHFLSRLCPNLKSALAWEMCLDGGGWQMTYKEIKDAARWVEQREDPSMSGDPFVRENAASTPWDDGQQDWGGQPQHNQYGGQMWPSNHSWPAVRAVNMEDPRVDCPDGMDSSNLEDGVGDGALTQMIMKMQRSFPHPPPPLLPCSHCMLRQPILHTIMNSRSSDVTPVMRLGTSCMTVPSASRP